MAQTQEGDFKYTPKFQRYGKAGYQGRELQRTALEGSGRHEETRTPDLYRVKS
jgi:hypothetical protein